MNRNLICWSALGVLAVAVHTAFAADYPKKMDGNAAIVCKFEDDVLVGKKFDLAEKYLTQDFAEHNAWMRTNGLAAFKTAIAKMPDLEGGAQSSCPSVKVVVQQGDYVMFMRECKQPGCMNFGPELPVPISQFDLYRFKGGKIAEHWDSIMKPEKMDNKQEP